MQQPGLVGSVEGVVAKNLIPDYEPNNIAVYGQLGLSQNEAGQVIPDVEVSISGRTARTDAQGRFRISTLNLPPGTYELTLRHSLYKQQGTSPLVSVRPFEVTTGNYYMRAPYGNLNGKLIDVVTNKPILHPLINGMPTPAFVYIPENANVLGDLIDEVDFDTKAFSISVLAGSREVKVKAPGYKPFSTRVTLADAQAMTMDLKLEPLPATLTGNVKDSLTAQKLPGAAIQVKNRTAITDPKGEYMISNVIPHEKIQIRVSKEGYEDTVAETVLAPGQERQKDFVLAKKLENSSIRARITEINSGKPLPGVMVRVLSKAPNNNDLLETYCTDNTGSFVFRVDKNQGCIVNLYRDGYDFQKLFIIWSTELKHWHILPTDPQGRGSYYVNPADPVFQLVSNPMAKALFKCSDYSAATGGGQASSGQLAQELTFTVNDVSTGRPIPGAAITGMQVTNRAKPFRLCTNERGIAVLRDVSIAVGSEAAEMIQNLSLNRNGYEPRQEREYYATYAGRNAIFTLKPNASYQMLDDCTNQRQHIQYAIDHPIKKKDQSPDGVLQVQSGPPGPIAQQAKPVTVISGVPSLAKAGAVQELQAMKSVKGSPGGVPAQPPAAPPAQAPEPDLEMVSCRMAGNGKFAPGADIELLVMLKNISKTASQVTKLAAVKSTDTRITATDTPVAQGTARQLAAGESMQTSLKFKAPGQPGNYYYGACIEPLKQEKRIDNNCSGPVTISVLAPTKR